MRYLHTMVRVHDLEKSIDFYCTHLGMKVVREIDRPEHRYKLVFLSASDDESVATQTMTPTLELTFNYDTEDYGEGRNFGHLAFRVLLIRDDTTENEERILRIDLGEIVVSRLIKKQDLHDSPSSTPAYSAQCAAMKPEIPPLGRNAGYSFRKAPSASSSDACGSTSVCLRRYRKPIPGLRDSPWLQ